MFDSPGFPYPRYIYYINFIGCKSGLSTTFKTLESEKKVMQQVINKEFQLHVISLLHKDVATKSKA